MNIAKLMARQEQQRLQTLNSFNRGTAAIDLAELALNHYSSGAEAAAKLLLSMEHGEAFDFRMLIKLDTVNRAKADLIMAGYKPHELWPSKWMTEAGRNGRQIMEVLGSKWAL